MIVGDKDFRIKDSQGNAAFRLSAQSGYTYIKGNLGRGVLALQKKLHVEGQDILLSNNSSALHFRTDSNGDAFISNMNAVS